MTFSLNHLSEEKKKLNKTINSEHLILRSHVTLDTK